ncbi:MAG: 2-amino-4-hydroxy-6-hydroxymethyldihydropteridine diphosphokinase [Planctomycetota bacterium]|nr:2-amino-4-hydroxy-6-hydroxymethyldihydropteridine diphosphokinase [Planctomycetota bacterium]
MSDLETIAYLGFGSNLGDRLAAIMEGIDVLDGTEGVRVRRVATILETEPVGVEGHEAYLNTVVEIETGLPPRELLDACLSVERSMGRERTDGGPVEPRRLDIDLLLIVGEVVEEPGLRVPHPRMHERAFVLVPMVELAPELVHPGIGITMKAALVAETDLNGSLEGRCAILKPRSLLDEGPMSGPAGLSPG